MLCTFLKLDRGSIKINNYEVGKDDEKIKSLVGVVFQESVLDELLTVKENLITRSKLYNMSKDEFNKNLEEIIDTSNIHGWLQNKIHSAEGRMAAWTKAILENNETAIGKLESVYAPVGINISSNSVDEIAFGIMAEILLVKNNGSLTHRKNKIK